MFLKYDDLREGLHHIRKHGYSKGDDTGFKSLDKFYSLKDGYTTIVLGASKSGKSEFMFELLLNQLSKYGKRALIYSPEMGNAWEIYEELIHKYTGRSIKKSSSQHLNDMEFEQSMRHVFECMKVINSEEKSYSMDDIYEIVKSTESELKSRGISNRDIKMIMVEPFTKLKHDLSNVFGKTDRYVEVFLDDMVRFAKKNKKHIILGIHPTDQDKIKDKDSGIFYYPQPFPREAMWGQGWDRSGFGFITLWRPSKGLNDENGIPYPNNTLVVRVDKVKPKGIGEQGTMRLYFDYFGKNRYYEQINGQILYAFEHEKANIIETQKSLNNIDRDEIPF